MPKRFYVAYGSNLNIEQMRYRCPTAKFYGTGVVEGYELQFRGQPYSAYATIVPKEGSTVPVAIWTLQPWDEMALDRYEGVPSHYFKQDTSVQMHGKEITGMVYIMNQRMKVGLPSSSYLQTVRKGYEDCGLDPQVLEDALARNTQAFFSQKSWQTIQHDPCVSQEEQTQEPDQTEIEGQTVWRMQL